MQQKKRGKKAHHFLQSETVLVRAQRGGILVISEFSELRGFNFLAINCGVEREGYQEELKIFWRILAWEGSPETGRNWRDQSWKARQRRGRERGRFI